MDFVPSDLLSGLVNYNRQEIPSISILGKNPLDERLFTRLRLAPFSSLSSEWQHNQNQVLLESGQESNGKNDTFSLGWEVFSLGKMDLQATYKLYSSYDRTRSGTVESTTQVDSLTQDYSLPLRPFPALTVTPAYSREDYRSETSASGRLETRAQVPRITVFFVPLDWVNFKLDYIHKITTRLNDDLDLVKKNLDLVTTLRALRWGNIVHSYAYEHNGGEVAAGGTLSETDYRKTIHTLTVNFNIPQNNPVLESVTLSASYKRINYENLLSGRAGDNFTASSAVFEGILNF
jgi:hypothetical protein